MELNVHVDRRKCMGSGQCVHWAPGVFSQDEEALSIVIDPHGEPEERIITAVNGCPVEAISLDVDGVPVETDHVAHWSRGLHVQEPLVSLLEELGNEHDRLRTSLTPIVGSSADTAEAQTFSQGLQPDPSRLVEWLASLIAHQRREETAAYPLIRELVGEPLVLSFERHYAQIRNAADRLSSSAPSCIHQFDKLRQLMELLDLHIRLEERILYPMALGLLASRPSATGNPDA